VGATLALLCLLLVGVASLLLARQLRRDVEPLFPDASALDRDPVAFTERLTEGGRLDEAPARFADIAARSGFHEAYALLGPATRDESTTQPAPAMPVVAVVPVEPPPTLATVADHDDDRRRATFVSLATANRDAREPEIARAAHAPPRAMAEPASARPVNLETAPANAHASHGGVAAEADGTATEPAAVRNWTVASADDDLLPSRGGRGRAA
jgi:hypothetical protein